MLMSSRMALISLLLFSLLAFAYPVSAGSSCSTSGYTVCGNTISCNTIFSNRGSYDSSWVSYCDSKCSYCGDTRINSPNANSQYEACDDGNTINTDKCNACALTICGDGIRQWPNGYGTGGSSNGYEDCDYGNTN